MVFTHPLYNPEYITPLALDEDLKTTLFLLTPSQLSDLTPLSLFLDVYKKTFHTRHDVSLVLYLHPCLEQYYAEATAFLDDLNQQQTEQDPDILVLINAIKPDDMPRLIARATAFIQLSSMAILDGNVPYWLLALLLDKQVVMCQGLPQEAEILASILFLVHLEQPETLQQALAAIFHVDIKLGIREQALQYLKKTGLLANFSESQPTIQTVRQHVSEGHLKEAVGDALHILSTPHLSLHLTDSFFMGHLFFEAGYYQHAVNVFSQIIQAKPDETLAWLSLGKIYLHVGELSPAMAALQGALQYEPNNTEAQRLLARIQERQACRELIPPIFLNGLGNSASEYLSLMLSQGLDIPKMVISSSIPTRDNTFAYSPSTEFVQSKGRLAKEHLPPSKINVFIAQKLFKKILISVRDPRGSLVSWLFFHSKVLEMRRKNPEKKGFTGGSNDIFADYDPRDHIMRNLNPQERLDFALESGIYADFVADITGWVAAEQATQASGPEYLFVVYEDFKRNEKAVVQRILDFYQIPSHLFKYPFAEKDQTGSLFSPTPNPSSPNYTLRRGSPTEWMDVLSFAQIQKATAMIPDSILERFHWPRLADIPSTHTGKK